MRGSRLLAVSTLALFVFSGPGIANETDNVPWDEIDRVLKEQPAPAAPAQASTSQTGPQQAGPQQAGPQQPGPQPSGDVIVAAKNVQKPAAESGAPAAATPKNGETQKAEQETFDDPGPTDSSGQPDDPNALPTPDKGTGDGARSPVDASPGDANPSAATPAQTDVPPAATPAPIVAHGDLLYLPFTRFFETRAAKALESYDAADRDAIVQFYTQHMGAALWVKKSGFNDDGKALIGELGKADDWGLRASAYKIPELVAQPSSEIAEDDLTEAEARLTLAALAYARDARGDRIPDPTTQLSSYLDRKPNIVDRKTVLAALASAPDKAAYLRSLNPKHPQFELLRQKLLALRAGEKGETFEKIPNGKNITPGKSHSDVALIRKRLKVPLPGMKPDGTAADANYYDQTLASAVQRFKENNGISPASTTITRDLRNALNKDTRVSEATLLANMEEWRWMPDDLGAMHIEVNIPEFMFRVVKDGQTIHSERIVVGKREQQTPIFSHRMSTIVFQPRWIVPNSIKVNELLPGLRYGGNPIARQGLVIERNGRRLDAYDVDWYRSDIRNYDIYQPPGPRNVLGVVKFLFPNKHAVYLHDTGSKSLFNEKVRMFSHGCVRVRDPVRLAEILLQEDKGWDAGTVNDVLNDGPEDNDISLDKVVPVHVTYFTAWVDDNGQLKTADDIYGHEKRIKLALEGRWSEIEKNRDHLLPADPKNIAVRRPAEGFDGWFGYDQTGRGGYGGPGYWSYNAPPKSYYKKKQKGGGGFFDQLFGGF